MKEQKYNAYLKEIGKFIPKDRYIPTSFVCWLGEPMPDSID